MIGWDGKTTRAIVAAALLLGLASPSVASDRHRKKLDKTLSQRAGANGTSRVIIRVACGADPSREVLRLGGRLGRRLGLIDAQLIEVPNSALTKLAERSEIISLHHDRPTAGELNRTAVTVGARSVQQNLGYTGAGVGIAVIDSGITSFHDDLTYFGTASLVRTLAGQRTVAFVDFVNGRATRYDDNGHGTHVAGIIAGNGFDSLGARAGIAPGAHLIGLKVLDQDGRGVISNVIAALEWVVVNKSAYNIRIANLSVGAAVTESYRTDPLALAAKRAVDAGVVVVTAAGNLGKNANGRPQYGAVTAPGNAPWVFTVGASSHEGTVSRTDDVMGSYSSRGPTAVDFAAKPDVVAPGTGTASLSDPTSLFYVSKGELLLSGSFFTSYKPYLSLTGTSMAAPVVSGTVALMLQANPSLTPNLVKAIVQYTAQEYAGYDALTQGAGFLNTRGAVHLARFFRSAQSGSRFNIPSEWSRRIIWGNHRIRGGVLRPNANAYLSNTVWGALVDADGDNIVWGTLFGDDGENIVWGTFDRLSEDNIVWGTVRNADGDNIVWGTYSSDDNIVWGTAGGDDNIVWGTDCGGSDCENIVWGTAVDDNIVWGTASGDDNIVWGTAESAENIVWGTAGDTDNIVWGTASDTENATWGSSAEATPLFDDPNSVPVNFDETAWQDLFGHEPVQVATRPNSPPPSQTTVISVTGIPGGGF